MATEDEEPEEEGICMNCGAKMDFNPMHPWCPDCSEDEEDDDDERTA